MSNQKNPQPNPLNQSVILVDADGVLLNWEYAFSIWMETHGFSKVPGSEFEYDIGKRYNIEHNQGRKLIKIFNESAAIGFLPPHRDAMFYVKRLHEEHGFIFHCITSLSKDKNAQELRKMNLRKLFGETAFEKTPASAVEISEQEYYDNGVLMVAMVRAGVELAFEAMTDSGIIDASAYYESLHETPLIANTIARRKLYEMNSVISDTAEYGCYLFDHACKPLLADFMKKVNTDVIGKPYASSNAVDNLELIAVNDVIRTHPIETTGKVLRSAMTAMKVIKTVA